MFSQWIRVLNTPTCSWGNSKLIERSVIRAISIVSNKYVSVKNHTLARLWRHRNVQTVKKALSMQLKWQLLLSVGIIFFCLVAQFKVLAGFGAWNKFAATDATCAVQGVKLLSLLNLLCNTTQTTSLQMRDACYGCFFRAGNVVNGPTQLTSLNDCAGQYISNTEYGECATNLQSIVDGVRASETALPGFCYTGYCEFVRCIRRINSRRLILSCYVEVLRNREVGSDSERINFYTNVTSCILARTRCSQYNPISGALQNPSYTYAKGYANWLGNSPYYFNSLQFSDAGELRIISFPAATNVGDLFCSRTPTLQQSGFGSYVC